MYCDLHIHTCFSDSTLTPEEVASIAAAKGLALISVTDHNTVAAYPRLIPAARKAGVPLVAGVELDCVYGGRPYHLLGYGFDLEDPALNGTIRLCRQRLLDMSSRLVELLSREDGRVSPKEYAAYSYEPTLGGWAGLHDLYEKGVAENFSQVMELHSRLGVRYETAGFPSLREVCQKIHGAGGFTVLAHPGQRIPHENLDVFRETLSTLLAEGVDGVECFYPTHSPALSLVCQGLCWEQGRYITCGCDCHGAFSEDAKGSRWEIGALPPQFSRLHLPPLPRLNAR